MARRMRPSTRAQRSPRASKRARPKRARRSPQRFKGSVDEHLPCDAYLRRIAGLDKQVEVTAVQGKGLGVVARGPIPKGTSCARYEFKVVLKARAPAGDYRVGVDAYHVGKIDTATFAPTSCAVANVGALLNEPNEGEEPNCRRLKSEYWGPMSSRRGVFYLQTVRHVKAGAELTWDYGQSYGRREY